MPRLDLLTAISFRGWHHALYVEYSTPAEDEAHHRTFRTKGELVYRTSNNNLLDTSELEKINAACSRHSLPKKETNPKPLHKYSISKNKRLSP